jgi:hypothetical protein
MLGAPAEQHRVARGAGNERYPDVQVHAQLMGGAWREWYPPGFVELGALYPQDASLSVDVFHTQSGNLAATKTRCVHQNNGDTVDGVWQGAAGT